MTKRRCTVILDLQFGSTGKGLIAGYLAKRNAPDTVVTAWAANAGHTYIDSNGRKFVHTMLANGIVSPELKTLLIGPGSVIDPINLAFELEQCNDLLMHADVMVHPSAAVITEQHREEEKGPMTKIGSTKKGVGSAMIQRIRRDPDNMNTAGQMLTGVLSSLVCTPNQYRVALETARIIQIEGAQGHSLSLYHGFYPYTTSRDVSVAQTLADCAVPAHWPTTIVGTARTYPIRVANRYDASGKQVGWSGPWYADQQEMEWSDLGLQAELTTVTKLPRRIASFSNQQINDAIWQNGVTDLFLNFVNYWRGVDRDTRISEVSALCDACDSKLSYLGFGPTDNDVVTIQEWLT